MIRDYFIHISTWLDPFFLWYFSFINIAYCILFIFGAIKVFGRKKELKNEDLNSILQSDSLPEISFLVPAYNESQDIITTIDNLLNLTYRYKQIIVINDGSTDNTFELLQNKYQLIQIPNHFKQVLPSKPVRGIYQSKLFQEIVVIDKENGEKYDALNAGLNICNNHYCITIDADTCIDDKDFEDLVIPMFTSPKTIAIGAGVRIRNGCTLDFNHISTNYFPNNYLTAMQAIEYLRTFLMRQGWNEIGGNWVISGAFAIFVTNVVVQSGGFAPTFANDLEIVIRLNRVMHETKTPYKIDYLSDPVAWTNGPQSLKALGNQRRLWQRGTLESIWFHKRIFCNPRYGSFGFFSYTFLILGEALEPLVELLAYTYIIVGLWLGVVSLSYVVLLLAIIWGFIFIFTLFCLLIEELSYQKYPSRRSLFLLIWYSLLENFGYRQLTVIWRLQGFFMFFKRFGSIRKDSKSINESIERLVKKGKIQW